MSSNSGNTTRNVNYNNITKVKSALNQNAELRASNKGVAFMNALKRAGLLNDNNGLKSGGKDIYGGLTTNAKKPISNATRNLRDALKSITPQAQSAIVSPSTPTSANLQPATSLQPPAAPSPGNPNNRNNNKKQKNDTKEISVEEWFKGLNGYSKYPVAEKVFSSPGTKSLPLELRKKFFNPINASFKNKNTNNTKATYPRIAELYACVFLALPGSVYGSSYVFTLKEDERRRFLTTKEFGDWFDEKFESMITNGNRGAANTYMKGLIDHVMKTYDINKSMQMNYTNSLTRARAERLRLKNLKGFANKNAAKAAQAQNTK